ncbi:MAG: peptidoglycan DD-metalloendopeptidase family protein [Clostridia bacterium]|nr:peptidoglycan DD-metalloendopeptidase family protein [Clostridia bacterium]
MKKAKIFNKKILCFALAAMFCIIGAGEFLIRASITRAATDANVTAMENKIKDIQTKKKDVLAKMNAAKNSKAEATQYKSYIDEQVNLTEEEITTINALIAELDNKIAEKEAEIKVASDNIETQYNNFKQIMRLSYEEGNASYVEMVLGSEDFYDFLVRIEQVTSLMEYSTKLLDSFKADKAALESAKESLQASKTTQVIYQGELQSRREELEALQEENANYLSALSKDISSYQATYDSYAKAEDELDKQLEKYLRELQAKENSQYVGGEFNWPLPLNWKSISSAYGYRTLNGKREFHRGIDIPASKNTNIYASNSGKVVTATFHYSYGNYVVIDHGGGKSTLYAHANKLNCKVGDYVKQGDVIAFVGTTGHSYGNHLHFEVRINGTAKNPLDYVVRPK